MALTAVETAIQGMADRLAYLRGAGATLALSGTDLWARVDASEDETFENRINGADLTLADAALEDIPLGQVQALRTVCSHLDTYCRTDLSLGGLDAYLTAKRWRVPSRFASLWYEATGQRLTATNVHPTADAGTACPGLALGTLTRGGALVGGLSAAGSTLYGPGVVVARVTAIGAADWTSTHRVRETNTEAIEQVNPRTEIARVGDVTFSGRAPRGAAGQAMFVAATAHLRRSECSLEYRPPERVWADEAATIERSWTNTS